MDLMDYKCAHLYGAAEDFKKTLINGIMVCFTCCAHVVPLVPDFEDSCCHYLKYLFLKKLKKQFIGKNISFSHKLPVSQISLFVLILLVSILGSLYCTQ